MSDPDIGKNNNDLLRCIKWGSEFQTSPAIKWFNAVRLSNGPEFRSLFELQTKFVLYSAHYLKYGLVLAHNWNGSVIGMSVIWIPNV